MKRQVWVDFNERDDQGRALTLRRFAEPGVDLSAGARILAGDHEGNLCWASVYDVAMSGVVTLVLDTGTFMPGEAPQRAAG